MSELRGEVGLGSETGRQSGETSLGPGVERRDQGAGTVLEKLASRAWAVAAPRRAPGRWARRSDRDLRASQERATAPELGAGRKSDSLGLQTTPWRGTGGLDHRLQVPEGQAVRLLLPSTWPAGHPSTLRNTGKE